jgi:hypothetical protein
VQISDRLVHLQNSLVQKNKLVFENMPPIFLKNSSFELNMLESVTGGGSRGGPSGL